jgi:predicted DNA binding protein
MADEGRVETKKVGGKVRIWWLPTDAGGATTRTATGESLPDITTDHALEFEFHSEGLARPFLDAGGPDVQVTVEGVVPLADGTQLQYWTISGIPSKRYVDIASDRPTVVDVRLLSTVGDSLSVELRTSTDSLYAAFEAFDGVPKEGRFEDGKMKIVWEFPAHVDLERVVEAAQAVYPDLELVAQHLVLTPRLFRTLVEERLTERQLTAFQLAYHAGYFDRPRRSSGDDLAALMSISRQTFHQHLRAAERTVADVLLNGADEVPSDAVHGDGRDASD